MYIKQISENHLAEAEKLQNETYGSGNCRGFKHCLEHMRQFSGNHSYGVYSNGKLRGYIIAYNLKHENDYDGDDPVKHLLASKEEYLYIEDLVCKNPIYLKNLLHCVSKSILTDSCYGTDKIRVVLKNNKNGFKIFNKIINKYKDIEIIKCDYISNYLKEICGKNISLFEVRVSGTMPEMKLTIKELINEIIFVNNVDSIDDLLVKLFSTQYEDVVGSSFEEKLKNIRAHKKYILRVINTYNKDMWGNVAISGDSVDMVVSRMKFYNNALEVQENILAENKNIEAANNYFSAAPFNFKNAKKVIRTLGDKKIQFLELHTNTLKYSDSLSSYRRFFIREIKFLKKQKGFEDIRIYDKYGDYIMCLYGDSKHKDVIPYNFSNIFDNIVREYIFRYESALIFKDHIKEHGNNHLYKTKVSDIDSILDSPYDAEDIFGEEVSLPDIDYTSQNKDMLERKDLYDMAPQEVHWAIHCANKIRTTVGIDCAIEFLNKISKKTLSEIHDWSFTFDELLGFSAKKYITKGGYKSLIQNFSLKKIQLFNKALKSIFFDNNGKENNAENIKYLRKVIGKALREKNIDLALELIEKESDRQNEAFLKTLSLGSKKINEEAISFVEEMKRYNEHLNLKTVISHLGKGNFKNILQGKIKGLFEEEKISFEFNYLKLGIWIKNYLRENKGIKKASKLFNALRKITLMDNIYEGNISETEYMDIVKELKIRGVDVPKHLTICNEFVVKVEKKCSPNFLMAGDASVCCMSFGESKSKTYALEEGFGIINVYYKNRVIANSLIWINEPNNCLVLDNIEVAPNYNKDDILINAKDLLLKSIECIENKYNLDFTVQGTYYNDLMLFDESSNEFNFKEIKPLKVKTKDFYTDAHTVKAVKVRDNENKAKKALSRDLSDNININREDYIEYEVCNY